MRYTRVQRVSCDFTGKMVHNHPSGDPTPSQADIEMTRQVAAAGAPLFFSLHDHLVIFLHVHNSLMSLGFL